MSNGVYKAETRGFGVSSSVSNAETPVDLAFLISMRGGAAGAARGAAKGKAMTIPWPKAHTCSGDTQPRIPTCLNLGGFPRGMDAPEILRYILPFSIFAKSIFLERNLYASAGSRIRSP